jgi:hypothetical protein
MAHRKIRNLIALSGLSATALYAAVQQPPDSVDSDGYFNTAMGTNALLNNNVPAQTCTPYTFFKNGVSGSYYLQGCFNTAAGDSAMLNNTTGGSNTALGMDALASNTSGSYNTASGTLALYMNTHGFSNSAFGAYALYFNTTGAYNTATGYYALNGNSTGSDNTATGRGTLYKNNGSGNTATGSRSLHSNTTGSSNTAAGAYSLLYNTVGNNMTAVGYQALYSNTTGTGNNAQGYQAMYSNTTGSNNAAIGQGALFSSTAGVGNNAIGLTALENMTVGNRNTAVGNNAGLYLGTGSYNTYIGWEVSPAFGAPLSSENYVTRIGVTYHDPNVTGSPTTYISGIYDVPLSGQTVVVTSTGQLGVASVSSERFKSDIAPMPDESARLSQLRPVTFRYKSDANGTTQYGLVAEEVARVYPELVIRDENGRIDGVRYDELAPMLLNEVQKEQQANAAQNERTRGLEATVAAQAEKIASLEQQLAGIQAALVAQQ